MTQEQRCPVCAGAIVKSIPYRNPPGPVHAELDGLNIAVCGACGFGYAVPERTWRTMGEFYARAYRDDRSEWRNSSLPLLSPYSIHSRALSQWALLKTFRAFAPGEAFCDIGPGGGGTFQVAQYLGLPLDLHAFEPDAHSTKVLQALGVRVVPAAFSPEVALPDKPCAAVIMSHVLEHYAACDINAVLRRVRDLTAPDGVFLCEVPNTPFLTFAEDRDNDAPHITFWTGDSFRRALAAAGWEVMFLAAVGEVYPEWRRRLRTMSPHRVRYYDIKRWGFSLPACLRTLADRLRWTLAGTTVYDALRHPEFSYSQAGDRVYLRALCTPAASRP